MNQQKSQEDLKEKVRDYQKSTTDAITKKQLFSDLINTFIVAYKRQSKINVKTT